MGNHCGTAAYRAKFSQYVITAIDTEKPVYTGLALNSIIQILVGVFSVICGSLLLGYGWSDRSGPHAVAAGIWCGVPVLVGGIMGALSLLTSFKAKTRYGFYIGQFGCSVSIPGTSSQLLRLAIQSIVECRGDQPKDYCRPHDGEMVALSACCVAAGSIMIITFVMVMIHYGLVHKAVCRIAKSISSPEDLHKHDEPPKDKYII